MSRSSHPIRTDDGNENRTDETTRPTEASSDPEPSVVVDGLGLTYSDGTEAVRDVSLSIRRGEFFGFLGPNGAGKTTTIQVLSTLLDPTDGDVAVNGYDVTTRKNAVRGSIGYMAQSVSVDEELTAQENLAFACEAYGVSGARRGDRIDELLSLVDLADVADTPAGQFSAGMKKRLDAATALVHDPRLVFLDEPTTGLDPKARNELWEYFRRINDEGTTIFLTTQYLEEADELCDRLAVIRDGTIVADGSPADLKRRVGGETLDVDLGSPDSVDRAAEIARESGVFGPDAAVDPSGGGIRVTTPNARERGTDLLLALRDAGIDVTGFDVDEPSLDDVFLAIADEGVEDLDPSDGRPGGDGA